MGNKFLDEVQGLLKIAFIAGCKSRNEGYQTISHEIAFNEWFNELNEYKFDEWIKKSCNDRN